MQRPAPEDDATVVLRPPAARPLPKRRGRWALAGAGAALALAALAVWGFWPRPAPPPAVAPPTVVAPPPAAAPPAPAPFAVATADEAAIRDHVAAQLTVFRFALDPRIVVLDFPTLHEQGAMLNRVAALVEKAGAPHDRVLTDAELDALIRTGGDTAETFYYGHDYPAGALVRFFALADAGHVPLDDAEQRLRALVQQLGWFAPGAEGALISIPRVPQPAAASLDAAARATMLHHELSHGAFFTDAPYAAYVHGFWDTALTAPERDGVRRFLASEGYDTADEPLMFNEMQAYVMFTADPRFFQPANIGITPARRAELVAAFLGGMPTFWLRDALAQGAAAIRAVR